MRSVQERLWRERSLVKHPQSYEYPTEGYVISTLYTYKDAEFLQVADFAKKQRIYYIFLDAECQLITTDRAQAGESYDRAVEAVRRRLVE
jgi:hypothetical protein